MANFKDIASKAGDFVIDAAKNHKSATILSGVAAGGLGVSMVGGAIKGSSDRVDTKIDKLERKRDSREDAGNAMVVAGAIATAGVGGIGLSSILSKASKVV